MDGASAITAAAPAAGETEGSGGLTAAQEQEFNVALVQAAGNVAAANFGILRSIMSDANKQPQ